MLSLLWLVPILPFLGFVILAFIGPRLSRTVIAVIGVGSVGVATVIAFIVSINFILAPPPGNAFSQTLWTWIAVGDFRPTIAFYLDALSLVYMVVVAFVSFLIHLYSAEFMLDQEGYSRFFAYMNLFVGSMLTLVLADNLLLLYLGWEGVGLCSYLLIGFWYKDPANGNAARKAFVVTRVGDTALAIGLFVLFVGLGTLQLVPLLGRLGQWVPGSILPTAAALLLLGGAVGKSAQLPLQTWLPDAMAGPTPVSALIHAATMVTAGVYLIARRHALFSLAPVAEAIVAIVGALTLLLAGFSALTQWDIKRVLAYSTISQIGYMFLALGVGAWSAAVFHFMTHAFFKALLFLGAGIVIVALHEEHNMFKMGGLRKRLPVTFWTFLIAACSLSALPLVTAGFYSKDLIIFDAYSSQQGSIWLWIAGVVGAFLTALYSFRMVYLTFYGKEGEAVKMALPLRRPGIAIQIPLIALAVLSVGGGWIELPRIWANVQLFTNFLHRALPAAPISSALASFESASEMVTAIVFFVGLILAYFFFLRDRPLTARITDTPLGALVHHFWFVGWGFDWLYDVILVHPYMWLARVDKGDVVDLLYRFVAWVTVIFYRALRTTQTGQVRWYAAGVAMGAVAIIAIVVLK